MVTLVCWTIHETRHQSAMCKETNATAVFNAKGNWEPCLETICAEPFDSGISAIHIQDIVNIMYMTKLSNKEKEHDY